MKDKVIQAARDLGLEVDVVTLDAPTRTVAEVAAAVGSDPEQIARLKDQPEVDHVTPDARLEPFGWSEPSLDDSIALDGALARTDCGASTKAVGTAAQVARDLGVKRIRTALMSGYEAGADGGGGPSCPFIKKPFLPGEIVTFVGQLLVS